MFNLNKGRKLKNIFNLSKSKEVKTVKAVAPTQVRTPELTMRQPYTGGTRWTEDERSEEHTSELQSRWTEDEDNIVKSFYNLGVKPAYISEALTKAGYERSAAAVSARVHKLNKLALEE